MELSVFPVRTAEAVGPKQVSGGKENHYTNNESAASKADSGDDDTFSRHMRSNDEKTARDDQSPSKHETVGEQKVNEASGDQKLAKMNDKNVGDVRHDDFGLAIGDMVATKQDMVKKSIMLAPLTTAPIVVGAFSVTNAGEGGGQGQIDKANFPVITVSSKDAVKKDLTGPLLATGATIDNKETTSVTNGRTAAMTPAITVKTMPIVQAVMLSEKPGIVMPPINGALSQGMALPIDLAVDAPIDELPDLEIAKTGNFKSVKVAPMTAQLTMNTTLMTFAAGLDDFQPLVDTGLETKSAMMAGTEGLSMMKPGLTSMTQVMAASQPAATTAAAQLVAAIRTESKSGNIEVRLDPPEMGRVRISLSVETPEAVKAVLTVERPETLDHLRRNMGQFTDDLRLAGFTSVDVEFSENGDSAFQDEAASAEHDPFASFVPETTPNNIVYLSLRENAQLDLLV